MPLFGALDVKAVLETAPEVRDLGTEPWTLPGAEVLHLLFELGDEGNLELIPPALHPTIPPTCSLLAVRAPESPAGPFLLVQLRVGCRASAFQRAYVVRSFCDAPGAAEELRARWGFEASASDARFERRHDRLQLSVPGILEASLVDPIPIGVGDVRYVDSLNPARVLRDGAWTGRLIQIDPSYEIRAADRGEPELAAFDAAACGAPGLAPVYPVSGSYVLADVTLPALRFLIDPTQPAYQGTERV